MKNKLAIKGCRKISLLKIASSPMKSDQVYLVKDETASKDTRLGYKHVLHVVQSQKLKAQVLEDNWPKRKASNEVPEDVSRP